VGSTPAPHFSTAGVHVGRGCQQTKAVNRFPHFGSGDRVGFESRLAAECPADHVGRAGTKVIISLTCIYTARVAAEFQVTKSARGYNNDLGPTLTLCLRFVREQARGIANHPSRFSDVAE
jgi:hypothetical protein